MSLYPPPKEHPTEVWSEMPEELRVTGTVPEWAVANKRGAELHSFLEGPSFDRDGNLYLVDIPYGRILRVSPEKRWELIADYDGWPNGLRIHKDGRIFIADRKHGILRLDAEAGTIEPVLTHWLTERFKGPNDLVFDLEGQLYFTDQGQSGMEDPSGRVFRYDLETERLDCLLDCGPSPNGLVLSPDGTALYVGMTRGNAVWRLPMLADGRTSKVGIFTQLAGGVSGADGLTVDREGRVFVCDAGNGCVWVFSPWGEPVYRIGSCTGGRTTTNLAFGGPDNTSLFITESDTGTVLRAELDVPGETLYSHR
ncbi:MAG: SMP-30/gluconolactonase/LRE family protein [Hyphomicrobiales bacterium]|nr:SMP-30/gluconolactonase/LRE family protein [Hyphomicrobiales bacterium]